MPTRTNDEPPPLEPPPTQAPAELFDESFSPELRLEQSLATCDESPKSPPPSEPSHATLTDVSEATLLGLMSLQRGNPSVARDAWDELYRRHARYVFVVVSRGFSDHLQDAHDVPDVVSDTFREAFDWAGRCARFDEIHARFSSPIRDDTRRRVLGWLSVIARRVAANRCEARARAPVELLDGDIDSISSDEEDSEPPPAAEHPTLRRALKKLNDEELEALRVSLPWYQPESGEFAFARGEAAKVASSLGITPDTLRQRRCRALRHVESLLLAEEGFAIEKLQCEWLKSDYIEATTTVSAVEEP